MIVKADNWEKAEAKIRKGFKDYESLITDPDLNGLKNYAPFAELVRKYLPDWKGQ